MFRDTHAFSGFSSNDISKARAFYGGTLGLDVSEEGDLLRLNLALAINYLFKHANRCVWPSVLDQAIHRKW